MGYLRLIGFRKVYFYRFFLIILLILISIIPLRLTIAYYQYPTPQAIFTLGGGDIREKFTATFSLEHPSLPIWVSSGIPRPKAERIFQKAGVPLERVHLDYRAVDTVTNFTTMVSTLEENNIHHVYLITSSFHMTRAKAIATLVLGSRAIAFTPVTISSKRTPESFSHVLRDVIRSVVWLITGRTGASLRSIKTNTNLIMYPVL